VAAVVALRVVVVVVVATSVLLQVKIRAAV
jgi:hypothetical protein